MADPNANLSFPLNQDDGYAIRRRRAMRRCQAGDSVIGDKIGCIGPTIIAQFGMSGPIRGRLFASDLQHRLR